VLAYRQEVPAIQALPAGVTIPSKPLTSVSGLAIC
jgi:hypothetical protein